MTLTISKMCERFEPRSHFKSRLCLIVGVNVVLNRTVVVDSDYSLREYSSKPLKRSVVKRILVFKR